MGCGTSKDIPHLISYQREFLGACWNSPYDQESSTYIRSRWMGVSTTTMALHAGNRCFALRNCIMRETLVDTPSPAARDRMADSRSVSLNASFAHGLVMGPGGPRWTTNTPQAYMTPTGTAPLSLVGRGSSRGSLGVDGGRSPGEGGGGPGSPGRTIESLVLDTNKLERNFYNRHLFLQLNGLSVQAGVVFRCAPARRRYHQLSFASVVDVDPIAQEDLENNCGAVSPADSPNQHTSAGLTDYSAVDPSFANLGMSFCSAPSGVEHYADDPFRINPLNPHHNYPIVDKDVLAVRATTPPVIIGSVSVIELQRLPPNAEICFGGWLYLSLEDEQRRLRKTLAAFAARLEAYERRRQHRRRSGSVSSKHASAATASDATRGRAAATPLVSSSGSGTWAAPPPKRTQSTLQPPSKRPTLLAPMEPRRRSSFSYGIGEGGGGDAVRREPFPYQDLFSDPDVILPYAYLIVALPMYECGIAPTTYHASTNHSKPVSLNLDSHRSRESFGVGCITSVRYGGVMIIECREKMGPWDLAWLRRLTDLGKQAAGAEDASSPLGRTNGLSGNFISPESLLAPDELERFRAAGHNAQRHRAELLHQLKSKMRRRLVRSGMHVVMASTRVAARRRRLLRRAASPGASFGNDGRPGPDSNSDDSENEMDQAESSGNSEEESDDLAAPLLRGGRVMQKHGRLLHVLPKDQTEVRGTFRQIGGVRYFHAESLMKGCTSVEVVLGVQQWAVHLLAKPSKARPLCLYLQRYEGIGHALRLANSQVYSGLQTVDPPLSAGSFAMMSNNNHGGPTPVPLSAMHGGGLGVSRQVSTMDLMGGDTGMFPWAAANTAAEYDARAVGGALPSATMGGSFAGPVMAPQRPPSTVGNMSFDSKLGIARVFGGRGGVSMELGFHTLYTGPLDPIVAPVFTPEVEAMIHRLGATNNTARTPRRGRSSMEVVSEASGNTRGYAPSSAYSPGHSRMPTRQPTVIGTERGGGGSACSPLSPEYLRLETELRDLRSELDEVQFLVSNAQQELRQRIEEFVQLATAFLPHTRADQMGPKLLHVKMLRQHPEDCPMKELHADWLPLLMLLFTCPRSQLLCLEQPAAVEPGSELNSSYLFAGLHHLVSALDVCNANRRREMDLEPNTKYTIESFPRLVAPRRLRDLVVAPSPKHRATSRLVEVAGVEGCISYYFTGGSLGVLAGAIRYLADHIRRNYEHEMQRSTGGQALKGGERVGLACRCSAEVLERDQNVFLQRLWLWGATEGTKKGRDLWAKQQRQRHEEAENGEQPTHHIAPEVLAEDVVVGVRFAPTEAFAIFDAIAAYLNVFVEVELDFARRRRAAEEEAAAAAAAASSPISSPPLRRRHSVLAPLSRLKFAGERKGRNESSDDEEDPRRRGNSREPFAEDDEAAALDREGLIVTRFDLCVASNYYYKQHYLQREPIIEANTLSGPSRRGSVVSRQPPPPAAAARRARSQEPSSGNWRKMEVPYTGGEEVRRPRAEKSFNRFYRFLKDNFRAWKVARSNDPAVVAASRFMSVSKA